MDWEREWSAGQGRGARWDGRPPQVEAVDGTAGSAPRGVCEASAPKRRLETSVMLTMLGRAEDQRAGESFGTDKASERP